MKKSKSLLLFSLIFLTSCGFAPTGVDALTIKPGGDKKDYNVVVYCNRKTTDVTIPKVYEGMEVKSIGKNVFKDCEKLVDARYEGTVEEWCKLYLYNEYSNVVKNGCE